MLILTRKVNEAIALIGPFGEVIVTVLKNDRGVVKLGIEAPRDVTVLRSEVKQRMENAAKPTDFCETMRTICEDERDGK